MDKDGLPLERFENAFVHSVAVLHGGECIGLNLGYIGSDSVLYLFSQPGILFSMFGNNVGVKSEHVVNYLNLTVAIRSSTDADNRDGHILGNQLGKRCRDTL